MALPIIGSAARFEDEINAQMDTGVVANAAVNTVGAAAQRNVIINILKDDNGKPKMGAAVGVATCKICSKPGHNARDQIRKWYTRGPKRMRAYMIATRKDWNM